VTSSSPITDGIASDLLADAGWRVFRCAGRHAERYLNGQLTCDVKRLEPGGGAAWFALLDVGGRLRAWGLLAREAPERFVAWVPATVVDDLAHDLASRIIADDVSLETLAGPVWFAVGPEAWAMDGQRHVRCMAFGGPAVVGCGPAPAELATDRADAWWQDRALLSGTPWGRAAPVPGQLVTDTGLVSLAVARDKGCYLGQETVNKVLSGRGPARSPVWFELRGPSPSPAPATGVSLSDVDGRALGRLLGSVGEVWLVAAVREVRVDGLEIDLGAATAVVRTRPPLARTPRQVAESLSAEAARRFADGDDVAAEARFRLALRLDPSFDDAYESLGVLCGRQGRYAEALDLMDQLLTVDPDSVMAHSNKSLYLNHLGEIEKAEDEAREAAAASVRRAARKRASADEAAERELRARAALEDRERMFRQVLDLDGDDVLANFALGELLVDAGRFDEALDHLERAKMIDPKHSAAHLALGRCLEALGRVDDAVDVYRRGVQVASSQGDLQPANRMQTRLAALT
jgi:tetratricopeptide (TPR) repeat protein